MGGIHVRRGDKLEHEDKLYLVTEYLDAARKKGWDFEIVLIMTDDPDAVTQEADKLELDYFLIEGKRLPGHGDGHHHNYFDSNAFLLEEVACVAVADYFVGQIKSNIAWLVQQHRTQALD